MWNYVQLLYLSFYEIVNLVNFLIFKLTTYHYRGRDFDNEIQIFYNINFNYLLQ